jgi:4-diphosphocytidyl-2-C-methyl-D-erythritol kinase
MVISEIARAKINLTLRVLGRRPDGYHQLESLVTFADVGDRLTFEPGPRCQVTTSGPFAHGIVGTNLLDRTLELLGRLRPALQLGSVQLEKNLPVAAGMGGGSADAAALLRAVRAANPALAEDVAWLNIAAGLGADVSVCLTSRSAWITGIGETVAPLSGGELPVLHAVLVNPRLPLATAQVFRALDAPSLAHKHHPSALPDTPGELDGLVALMRARGNDLERPATRLLPLIAEIKAALAAQPGCRIAALSGSGPTCFAIFGNRQEAKQAARTLASANPGYWIVPARLAGPLAPGALSSPG